jgi:pyruvate-formate lyase
MAFNAETAQNVEVSIKIPPELSVTDQLELMEKYTAVHSIPNRTKEEREAACLKVLYPTLFRSIEPKDLIAGRLDFLPIGFGCVTSVGGVGHYCVFNKLTKFKALLPEEERPRVDALYRYWLENDLKTKYCRDALKDDIVGMFIDCDYPLIATARLSGMMLDYRTLMELGIGGLRERIVSLQKERGENAFYHASLECLDLFAVCCDALAEKARRALDGADADRQAELRRMIDALGAIREAPPKTFFEALQLFWLYALLAGVINYGRMDDVLGPFLQADLNSGRLTEHEAYRLLKSLWTMIENRRTTVNGRIIVGGRGRRDPEAADTFARIAMKVAQTTRYVEPQFTLRFDRNTPEDIYDAALDTIGKGATYPTLYNDDVNIPAVMRAMRVDEGTAEQYVPFGCGEFVIQGQSTGTPNTCINLLKLLQISLNGGIDPMDGKDKSDGVPLRPAEELNTFEAMYSQYKRLLDHYLDLSVAAQTRSYEIMNEEVSFLFTSILMNDCLGRGRAVLDGGIRYLGGTNETYGNINVSDSLAAIKKTVFEDKICTLPELRDAANRDFAGQELLHRRLWECPKYGNDDPYADDMADDLFRFVANGVRDRGIAAGMQYYLIVISNNQLNTEWGRRTAASYDGRHRGQFMNPANNPQGGANRNGPSAMLNSLAKFDAGLHGGSVQNIKFTPDFFNNHRDIIKQIFRVYFDKGGCHLMVTVVDRGVLEDAVKHPDGYRDLIVRVSGFSAVFVNLEPDIQQELISRVLYG